jgi:hypothetical protein
VGVGNLLPSVRGHVVDVRLHDVEATPVNEQPADEEEQDDDLDDQICQHVAERVLVERACDLNDQK